MDDPKRARSESLPVALTLLRDGRYAQALPVFRRAADELGLDLRVLRGLAECQIEQGQVGAAISTIDQILARGDDPGYQSARLVWSYFDPEIDDGEIFRRHVEWGQRVSEGITIPPHRNDPSPDRRLKIGYLCSTIRSGVTMAVLGPLLEAHDRSAVEIYCYNNTPNPDNITDIARNVPDHWRDIATLTDPIAAELIRHDQIDILVDMDLHLPPNRIALTALKPAPIHLTGIQYPGTSGLKTMDYVLVAKDMITPGCERFFTEKLLPLDTLWTFRPRGPASPNEESAYQLVHPPAIRAGHITFGSLNNTPKLNLPLLQLWRRILDAVPNSRLLLHVKGSTGAQVEIIEQAHLDPSRVEVIDSLPQLEYTRNYQRIDIALDPFPYGGGGGTAFDVLWAGVPLVTLAGHRPTSRYATSILNSLGLEESVATTLEQYLDIATNLASRIAHIQQLRQGLRERLRRSVFMDESRYAADLERAYRIVWQKWCEQHSAEMRRP